MWSKHAEFKRGLKTVEEEWTGAEEGAFRGSNRLTLKWVAIESTEQVVLLAQVATLSRVLPGM